ncbi:MAG TPA: PTS sugar transporter subunit IIA [Thermoanaerobaculales bacterium]|nr:PTS sugar transporter subunit IIA [Thermoanaerobaculales bacterium]HPA81601.1 PTS sugar transporter subunit IIA [Thermoanaerobaculales bacterium]HQL31131.1 PTS sugar transporter subunit IIA [Thermoanaerobaculales bacterium]HQN97496.1 PTS sugar transporter subunit IIA [Thermoanaerobaculales bacterium]HQP44527.1 PTS sugar transporter subunit IIA [Thermoanaerobaculales bacterium]
MSLRELADRDRVLLDVGARDAVGALGAAADAAARRLGIEARGAVSALMERERLGSTAVGNGFAIPHCKIDGLPGVDLSLVRLADQVDFAAPDDSPVRFLFVVLSPAGQPAAHLKVLSQIARILKRPQLRQELLAAVDADHVIAALLRAADAEGLS